MGIEHLKRWHWVALSVPIGLVAAWAMLETGPQGMQSEYATMGAEEFEARVLGRPRWGIGRAEKALDVRAYPLPDKKFLITAYLPAGEPKRDEQRRWIQVYRAHQLTRGGTYVPSIALPDPPQFRHQFFDNPPEGRPVGRDVVQTGWLKSERNHRAPGAAGATMEFALRKGPAYDLTVRVAPGAEKLGEALQLTLNDKPLPALKQDPAEPTRWKVAVPAALLGDGKQVLKFVSEGAAVPVGQVELINPAYTVLDFLTDARQANPSLEYSYRSAWEPRVAYIGWTIGSLIVVGGIWPTLLALMVGAGFGRAEPEPKYDLSRFRGGPEKKKAKKKVTAAAEAKVRQMADELEAKLLAEAKARGDGSAAPPAAAAEPEFDPAKILVSAPLEVATEEKAAEHKEYGGEYYPVVRKVEKHQE